MFPVSEDFLVAVQDNARRFEWTGDIKTKSGTVYEFGMDDIVKGSGYISSQCCGSSEIELGTVYSTEVGISLLSQVDRYTLDGAELRLFYTLFLRNGTKETIPMGVFDVSEANRSVKILELKAYDRMLKFDKSFNGFDTIGNAYDFMELCSKSCKVPLAQEREEIEALPNGSTVLSVYEGSDIETYRDVLYYVGQVLGGFFCINRYGELELRKYGVNPVMEVLSKHRYSSSFSDFITRYTAVSSTNMRTETAEYYALEPDDGLTLNLGVNPLLQFGLTDTRMRLCLNILDDLSVVNYVPFDSETIGNPALDLGDVIRFMGGHADGSQLSAITSMTCKIGGKHTLKGVGKNPRLAQAKSKNDKNISGLLNQISENKESGRVSLNAFTNASSFQVRENKARIITLDFAANDDSMAQFFASIVVNVRASDKVVDVRTEDGSTLKLSLPGHVSVEFEYEFNDEVIETHKPSETWCTGMHTMVLYYPIEKVKANLSNRFCVYMTVKGGVGIIGTGACIASVGGQNMASGDGWDGKAEIVEFTGKFGLGNLFGVRDFEANPSMGDVDYDEITFDDVIETLTIGGLNTSFEGV